MTELSKVTDLINRWWMDYVLITVFKEFKQTNVVADRDLVQYLVTTFANSNEDILKKKTYILVLLCKLADGENYRTSYEDQTELTVLEQVIDMFEDIFENRTPEYLSCVSSLKQQAVYVCCRAKDYATAMQVFLRQWSSPTEFETFQTMKMRIHKVINCKNSQHKNIRDHPYINMCSEVVALVEQIISGFEEPFLLKVAKEVIDTSEKGNSTQFQTKYNVSVCGPVLKNLHKHFKLTLDDFNAEHENEVEEMCKVRRKDRDKYIARLEQATKISQKKDLHDKTDNELNAEYCNLEALSVSRTSTPRISRKKRHSRNRNHSNTEDKDVSPRKKLLVTDETMGPSFEEESLHTRVKGSSALKSYRRNGLFTEPEFEKNSSMDIIRTMKARTNKAKAKKANGNRDVFAKPYDPPPKSRDISARNFCAQSGVSSISNTTKMSGFTRYPWSCDETEAFYQAVLRCGVGAWVAIKEDGFNHRSNVNLKDKWRNIVKKPQLLKALEHKYGPVD